MATATDPQPAEHLRDRLNDPQIARSLNRLLDQLDSVTFAIESVDGFVRRGDVIAESLACGVAELKKGDGSDATSVLNKAPQILQTSARLSEAAEDLDLEELAESKVLQRLTEPQTLATLNRLLEKLPLLDFLLESVEGFINRGETVADNLSDAIGDLKLGDHKFDPGKLTALIEKLPRIADAGEKLLDSELMGDGLPKVIDAGVSMVESGMMDKAVVRTLGDLGRKSVETYHEVSSKPVPPIGGLLATMKATRDPDVQKSMGFLFAFAKAFAKHL